MKQSKKTSIFEKQLQNLIKYGNLMQLLKQSNCFKRGGFSNQTDDSDSDDEDAISADLKEKWKTVKGNGRITDDATLSDILEADAELLTASYTTDEEILISLMDNNQGQENDNYSENEDVIQPTIGLKCYNHSKPLKEVSKWKKMCPTLFFGHS
ncbi:hypothetical protein AVEN_232349-1 [Araneus ventricosus]|uniref:Uncharacterized protein n=1 Tax=Araneus ventricosus TaxID=182803 RepID=A0A4Y2LL45_ARAVE|nr:hypothetical protein AVEN_232349-1 [Araneus ventricosus]